ncbi:WD40 repeat-like protein [Penicillium angulare]|uniref:WD40 repeat-like protein n=1 Tax=Penicillium angulare TaxID=116970 RepID=UPI00254040CB|nr:WD40 repeat-like protein [Penicillium angulare]KAJ5279998.1 WD40 repeat-like protein [Penicillium angulare]
MSLNPDQQRYLKLLLSETNQDTKLHSGDPPIERALRDGAETVQDQHSIRQAKNDDNRIQEAAKEILRAAWSLEGTVPKVVVVDPTGYSTAAWGVVSLGLKINIWDIEASVNDKPIRALDTFSSMIKIVFRIAAGLQNLSEPFASVAVSNTKWGIRGLRISKNGKILTSSSLDSGLELWLVEAPGIVTNKFQYKHAHTSHRFQRAMAFSQDGERVAFYSKPKVLIRDIIEKTQALSLSPAGQGTAFSPDGQLLIVADACELKYVIWDITKNPPLIMRELDLEEHSYFHTLVFAPDGKRLATSSIMGHIIICDLDDENSQTPRWIGENYGIVHSMRFLTDTNHIITEYGAFDTREDQTQEPKNSEYWQLALRIQDEWVVIGGHKCLWLPAEFWGCWTAYEGFLYIGTNSGIHCLGLRIDRDLLAKYGIRCTSTS